MLQLFKLNRIISAVFLHAVIVLGGCSSTNPSFAEKDSFHQRNRSEHITKPYVVLISIDGYRHDYTDRFSPPNLTQIRNEGASAKSLIPVFPSKTYPNHYSIVTGLYAENHGIVANYFYDFSRAPNDQLYKLANRPAVRDGSWYGGEPIWVTAEKQGMLTANYFWPGGEAAIQGVRPTYTLTYNESIPNSERVKQVLAWLKLPAESRPHFICLYFSDVDTAGHMFGTESSEVKEAVTQVDAAIGELRAGLEKTDLPVNVVIVSDHGMQDLDPKKVEYLDDLTDLTGVTLGDLGPQVLLYSNNKSKSEKIYADLQSKGKHFKIYRRNEMPRRYHYSKSIRIGDLVVIADAPYSVGIHDNRFKMPKANHGYDPETNSTMHGIFYSYGPNVKERVQLKSVRNIHIYPLILKMLDLSVPPGIDGDIRVLKPIYTPSPRRQGTQL